jgi:hypothetical protein
MKNALTALALLGLVCGAVCAASAEESNDPSPTAAVVEIDAETRALANELGDALHAREAFEQHLQRVVLARIQGQNDLVAYKDILATFYSKFLGWDAVHESLVRSYVKQFPKEELAELVKFYASPIGQKSVALLPGIAGAILETGMLEAAKNEAMLQEMVNEKNEIFQMQ